MTKNHEVKLKKLINIHRKTESIHPQSNFNYFQNSTKKQ